MKRHVLRLIVCIGLLLPGAAAAQPREDTLVVPTGQTYEGNLATITRDIRVEGVVTGDVTSWSGNIEVTGRVGGDVVSYGGKVMIRGSGQVSGHVLASGGALQLDAGAVVTGQAIHSEAGGGALANLLDLFSPTIDSGANATVGRGLFGAVLGVFLLAFCLLCITFWPRRTAAASLMFRRAPGRVAVLGLLTTLLLALALPPLTALLAATLIGLPLIVLLLALVHIPYIYGLAALVRAVGAVAPHPPIPSKRDDDRSLSNAREMGLVGEGLDRMTVAVAAALALLVAIVAALAPLWGLALLYLLASPGLGAVLLSRGGLLVPMSTSG